MIFLDKTGLAKFWENIKSKAVLSDTVRKIVIVEDYPEVEEEGVLYLKKYTGSSSDSGSEEEETTTSTNLWVNPTVISGWFASDASSYEASSSTTSKYAYISCKANTTYKITRTMDGYRFMVGTCPNVPDATEETAFTNYQQANDDKEVTITSGDTDQYLVVYYKGSSESLDETELLNDITVVVAS